MTTTTPRTFRASSMPLILSCAQAANAPEIAIDETGEATMDGTILHDAAARLIGTGEDTQFDDQDRRALWYCLKAVWSEVEQFFPEPMVEQELEVELGPIRVTGHADVVTIISRPDGKTDVRVLDWKTGRKQEDYTPQTLTYALMLRRYFGADRVTIMIGWVRDQSYESETFDAHILDAHEAKLIERLTASNPPYSTGKHCAWCGRKHECPARKALTRQVVDAVFAQEFNVVELHDLPVENRRKFIDTIALMKELVRIGEEAVRQALACRGPMDLGGGRMLILDPQERREIDVLAALPVLRDRFGQDAIDAITKLSVTDIDKLAMENAPRGQKKAAKENLQAALAEHGAISTKTVLIKREVPLQIEDQTGGE